jgi:hypothetical protein
MKLFFYRTSRNFGDKKFARFSWPTFSDFDNPDRMLAEGFSFFHKIQNHRAQWQNLFYSFGIFGFRFD